MLPGKRLEYQANPFVRVRVQREVVTQCRRFVRFVTRKFDKGMRITTPGCSDMINFLKAAVNIQVCRYSVIDFRIAPRFPGDRATVVGGIPRRSLKEPVARNNDEQSSESDREWRRRRSQRTGEFNFSVTLHLRSLIPAALCAPGWRGETLDRRTPFAV